MYGNGVFSPSKLISRHMRISQEVCLIQPASVLLLKGIGYIVTQSANHQYTDDCSVDKHTKSCHKC